MLPRTVPRNPIVNIDMGLLVWGGYGRGLALFAPRNLHLVYLFTGVAHHDCTQFRVSNELLPQRVEHSLFTQGTATVKRCICVRCIGVLICNVQGGPRCTASAKLHRQTPSTGTDASICHKQSSLTLPKPSNIASQDTSVSLHVFARGPVPRCIPYGEKPHRLSGVRRQPL